MKKNYVNNGERSTNIRNVSTNNDKDTKSKDTENGEPWY